MMRAVLIGLSVVSLFVFPWPLTLVLGFVTSLLVPPVAFVLGVAAELLYGAHGVPYAVIVGAVLSVVAFFVRGFVKARIIDA